MKRMKPAILVVVGMLLMLLVVQNTAPVQAHFLWMTAEVPVVVLLFLAVLGGFVSGLLVAWLSHRKTGEPKDKTVRTPHP